MFSRGINFSNSYIGGTRFWSWWSQRPILQIYNILFTYNRKSRIADIFKKLVFFSLKQTQSLQNKLGIFGQQFDLTELYQFEARYFQYSLIKNNILFIHQYTSDSDTKLSFNSQVNDRVGDNFNKQFMIFKFGCSTHVHGVPSTSLFGVCEENDRFPDQQPWYCKYVFYSHELFDFLSQLMRNSKSKIDRNDCSLKFCCQSDQNHASHQNITTQDWGSSCSDNCSSNSGDQDDILSNSSSNLSFSFNFNLNFNVNSTVNVNKRQVGSNCANNNNNIGSTHIRIQQQKDSNWIHGDECESQFIEKQLFKLESKICIVDKLYDVHLQYQSNASSIVRKLAQGLNRHAKNGNIHQNFDGNNGDRHITKPGNHLNKFDYIRYLRQYLSIDKRTLLDKLHLAIENAFIFSKKFPSTVLTQAYVDENKCKVIYELVLLAELQWKSKFFKFGVPVSMVRDRGNNGNSQQKNNFNSKSKNKNKYNHSMSGKIYSSRNILTPFTAQNNVRLNCGGGDLPQNSWVCDKFLFNDCLSFYNQYDSSIHRQTNLVCDSYYNFN